MPDRRYVVRPGFSKADLIVDVFDRVTDESFSTWSASLPAADTEWPAS